MVIDEPRADCWLWAFTPSAKGYARISVNYKTHAVHRLMYETFVGDIPDGLTMDHLCRIRSCINPSHVEPVTNKENLLRGYSPVGLNARKTHCKWGHKFTPDNIYKTNGGRSCRACLLLRSENQRKAKWELSKQGHTE